LTFDRCSSFDVASYFIFGVNIVEVGVYHAGAERVNPNRRAKLFRQASGHCHHSTLGCRVCYRARAATVSASLTGQIDDCSGCHVSQAGIGHQESAGQVQIHDSLPVFQCHFGYGFSGNKPTGVVNQNIYTAKLADGFVNQLINTSLMVQIALQRECLATISGDLCDRAVSTVAAGKIIDGYRCTFGG